MMMVWRAQRAGKFPCCVARKNSQHAAQLRFGSESITLLKTHYSLCLTVPLNTVAVRKISDTNVGENPENDDYLIEKS